MSQRRPYFGCLCYTLPPPDSKAAEIEARLTGIQRRIDGIMRAIEDGLDRSAMKTRLAELEAEKATLIPSRDAGPGVPNVSVHPNLAAVYRKKVEELETLLEDAEHKDEAMELIRSLIERIVLMPREEGGLDAVLHGDPRVNPRSLLDGVEKAKSLRTARMAGSKRNKAPDVVSVQGLCFVFWLRGQDLNL